MATVQSKNGVAKKVTAQKATTPKIEKEQNPIVQRADDNLKKMVTLQQRMDKLTELQKMSENYAKISETLTSIKKFKNASGDSLQFTIKNVNDDETFTTYNSTLIGMVNDILISQLQEKQFELSDKILAFEL